MSLSGIRIPPEVIDKFETDRMGDDGARMVLKLTDDNMVLEHDGVPLESLAGKLPEAEPRYIIYDVPIQNRANLTDLKTVFILYMPMTSPVRMRMMYSSTKAQITNNIRGITTTIQVEEPDEINLDYITGKVNKQQGINNNY